MGTMRVLPARSGGRLASRRAAMKAGEGRASTKEAVASGSLGRVVNPVGSISRASGVNVAHVVLAFRNNSGIPEPIQFSPGASGPQAATLAPRSQYTLP